MRNIWKGLIIGGLTGAGAGAVVDLFDRGARLVATAGHKAVEVTPEAVDRVKAAAAAAERQAAGTAPELANLVKSAVSDGVSRIHEADIGNHLSEGQESSFTESETQTGPVMSARHSIVRTRRVSSSPTPCTTRLPC